MALLFFFLRRGARGKELEAYSRKYAKSSWVILVGYTTGLSWSPNVSGKIDSGRVDLQAFLKSYQMVVDINLCQEFFASIFSVSFTSYSKCLIR